MPRFALLLGAIVCLAGCQRRQPVEASTAALAVPVVAAGVRQVRATGTIKAVREFTVQVPQISGQGFSRLTIVKVLPSGTAVQPGDVLAEFDRTAQVDNARDAQAKLDDLNHQIEQRQAENRANEETRSSEFRTSEADLAKARLQLRRNETLSEIERAKNEEKAAAAQSRIESLKKSHAQRTKVDAAALRIVELKRDRQAVALKRATTNVTRLVVGSAYGDGGAGIDLAGRVAGPARRATGVSGGALLCSIQRRWSPHVGGRAG